MKRFLKGAADVATILFVMPVAILVLYFSPEDETPFDEFMQ